MSDIGNIAASLAQSNVQQSQVSRASDAACQRAARFTQEMRRVQEDEYEKVETSYEASDDTLRIVDEEREPGRDGRRRRKPKSQDTPDDEAGPRLDVTA